MSTILKSKYYGHYVMSRKFECPYIETIRNTFEVVICSMIHLKFDRVLENSS